MVKYIHCEMCRRVYATETWIGEAHIYNGICSSCSAGSRQENQLQEESAEDHEITTHEMENFTRFENNLENTQSSPIELEIDLLSNLEQKATDALFGEGSIYVLIKEIKDELVDKAKERISETVQSIDSSKSDSQKVIAYTEKTCDYLCEYKDYMDNVVKKLQTNPNMEVRSALEKVFKETMANMPKHVAKDVLHNRKAVLKRVLGKALKWYNIYSDTEDVSELTKKMVLHPFNEIQKKFSTLPFYISS